MKITIKSLSIQRRLFRAALALMLIPALSLGLAQAGWAEDPPPDVTTPFGGLDSPFDSAPVRGSIPVTGWVLDDVGVESVQIFRNDGGNRILIGDAVLVEGARPDIEQLFPGYPDANRAGWGYMMLTNFLPNGGNGTFWIDAIAMDKAGNSGILGYTAITVDNANAVKPFGAIDSPAQGGAASGTAYTNWGWLLTPQPNHIPEDGSTIDVYVDGVNLGRPTYNQFREDIAALFPGYSNSQGAGGYYLLDTTAYSDGVHTIQWTARDDAGNSDGIGSRYFSIQNSEGSSAQASPAPLGVDMELAASETYQMGETGILVVDLSALFQDGTAVGPYTYAGALKAGEELRAMPVGATLDAGTGAFHWMPGPAFWGGYEFVFTRTGAGETADQQNIIVRVGVSADS